MSYYKKIESIVLPHLTSFQDDLVIHDKKALEGYTGKFLYAYRKTGTNLMKLDKSGYNLQKDLKIQLKNTIEYFIGNNEHFLYGSNGKVKPITKDELEQIIKRYIQETISPLEKYVEHLHIPSLAFNIFFFMKEEGRFWKSKLQMLVKNSSNTMFEKFSNNFDLSVLEYMNTSAEEKEIESLLYKYIKI